MEPPYNPKCPGCKRHPRECWVMPCLVLEIALQGGMAYLAAWAKSCGLEWRGGVVTQVDEVNDSEELN